MPKITGRRATSSERAKQPTTLDDLLLVLLNEPEMDDDEADTLDAADAYARRHGLPLAPYGGGIDYTSLPTFGGEEPADTTGIWSWDAGRLLVGTEKRDLAIVPRAPGATPEEIEALEEELVRTALCGARCAEQESPEPIKWDVHDEGHGALLWTDEERRQLERLNSVGGCRGGVLREVQRILDAGEHREQDGEDREEAPDADHGARLDAVEQGHTFCTAHDVMDCPDCPAYEDERTADEEEPTNG